MQKMKRDAGRTSDQLMDYIESLKADIVDVKKADNANGDLLKKIEILERKLEEKGRETAD